MANFEGTHATHNTRVHQFWLRTQMKTIKRNRKCSFVRRSPLTTESGRSRASSGSGQGDRERERTRIGSTYLLISALVRCHSTHRTEPRHTREYCILCGMKRHTSAVPYIRQVYRSPDGFPLSPFPHPFSIRRCIRFIWVDDDFIPAAIATHQPFRMWISAVAAAAFGSHYLFIRATRMRRHTKHKISQKNEGTNICFVHFDILIFIFFFFCGNGTPNLTLRMETKERSLIWCHLTILLYKSKHNDDVSAIRNEIPILFHLIWQPSKTWSGIGASWTH